MTRNRRWIAFFLILGLLAASAAVIEVWYNLRQQITEADLNAARELWRAKGPSDYDMEYTFKTVDNTDEYQIQVRAKHAVSARRNGQPVDARQLRYCTMPYLFEIVQDYLHQDSQAEAPRTFAVATFDGTDGHLIHYVRSVMSKRERQEITVNFHTLDHGQGSASKISAGRTAILHRGPIAWRRRCFLDRQPENYAMPDRQLHPLEQRLRT
jgi:hypothetical protein